MNNLKLIRIPHSENQTLRAWNAADELLIGQPLSGTKHLAVYHDTFGYLACSLSQNKTSFTCITDLYSQKIAIQKNLKNNQFSFTESTFSTPLEPLKKEITDALIKIPKSNDLFELYLQHAHTALTNEGRIYCGFMTRYFNESILKTAKKYFKSVEQTRAKKKARVMILSEKKTIEYPSLIHSVDYNGTQLQQYHGVFSANKIDLATQFLLDNLTINQNANAVLDLASGNGIIAKVISGKIPQAQLHVLDDSVLAIESSKLNLSSASAIFHHHYDLSDFSANSLDWIITNPPFHFGHVVDTSIALGLFKQSSICLREGGRLTIVANSNLGYQMHLKKWFSQITILKSTQRFHIYECIK